MLEDNAQRRIELQWFPLGVAGIITPWNAPINLAAGPLTSALYTGNYRGSEAIALHAAMHAQAR